MIGKKETRAKSREPRAPRTSPKGMTLLELIISMGIFMIAINVITALYQGASAMHRRVIATQRVSNDLRFALESMADDVRIGTIDYDSYGAHSSTPIDATLCNAGNASAGTAGRCATLRLIDEDGVRSVVEAKNDPALCPDVAACLVKTVKDRGNNSATERLSAKGVIVDSVLFQINAVKIPYCAGNPTVQPLVTITVRGHGISGQIPMSVQTSASSRVYKLTGSCS